MKTLIFSLSLILLCGFLFANPSFQVGLGGSFMPGQYDYSLLSEYYKQQNNNGIEGLDSSEISPVAYYGINAFGAVQLMNFLIRLDASISFPAKITVTYNDTSTGTVVPHTIEHKALFTSGTLWLGPVIELAGRGSLYFCTGPSVLYAAWRDKLDVTDNTSLSKDRQYKGMGVILPFMLGGEGLITEKIGISLEIVMIAQSILLETFSRVNLATTDNTTDFITFPIGSYILGTSLAPPVFKTRLFVVYHIN